MDITNLKIWDMAKRFSFDALPSKLYGATRRITLVSVFLISVLANIGTNAMTLYEIRHESKLADLNRQFIVEAFNKASMRAANRDQFTRMQLADVEEVIEHVKGQQDENVTKIEELKAALAEAGVFRKAGVTPPPE